MANRSEFPWGLVGGSLNLLLDVVGDSVNWTRPIQGQTVDILGSKYPLTTVRAIGARRLTLAVRFENDAQRNIAKQSLLDALADMTTPSYSLIPGDLYSGSDTMDVAEVHIDAGIQIQEVWGTAGERLLTFGLVEVGAYGGGPVL